MTKKKKKEDIKKAGRKEEIVGDTLQKLEDAFSNALTDEEACLYANISPRALYYYQERHPEFLQRKQTLRLTPNLAAQKTIIAALSNNVAVAQWWVTKKKSDEFGDTTKLKIEGSVKTEHSLTKEEEAKAIDAFENALRGPLTTKKK